MADGNSRILVVDDDKNICILLSSLIEREGFKALVAEDGEMALKMIRSEDPDLLLLDIIGLTVTVNWTSRGSHSVTATTLRGE